MCTDTCICYGEDYWLLNDEGDREGLVDPQEKYKALPESYLNQRQRSWDKNSSGYLKSGYEVFKWSSDSSVSYRNFLQCYDDWEKKAKADSSIDLKEVFGLDFDPPKRQRNHGGRMDESDVNRYEDMFEYYREGLVHMDFYSEIEDSFDCSGMC